MLAQLSQMGIDADEEVEQLAFQAMQKAGVDLEFDDDFEENDNWDMDGDALASAGFGTDEDYGYYGDGEW